MKVEDIRKILILGAGTMGHQIGFVCAASGYDVVLYDIRQEGLDKAMEKVAKLARRFVAAGRLDQQRADAAIARMSCTTDPKEAARDADLVSESVPEDPGLKGKIFAQMNELCPARTVFTTNTSTLVPSMFAAATGRPDRLVALHFHDVSLTNVVDIMPHPGTSAEVLGLVEEFARKIGQVAIVLNKENPGYVFNAMLSEWFRSAQTLASKGVADPMDIDRAWMGVMNAPIGPFGVMDTVGLDTVWTITDFWARKLGDSQSAKNAAFMKNFVDQGRLGMKSGKGVYEYPHPLWAHPDFLKGHK
ncbi:MAG: 3-hydroxyacyl-CoA dehydrogenase [Thermodesulfobacteriota bacterium]